MTSASELETFLRNHLLGDIMPFWLKHAVDRNNGGLFTCLSDEGKLLSREKFMWSQTRALWTFSALHNRIEPSGPWLDVAHQLYDFLAANGRDADGNWVFIVDEFGNTTKGPDSIVTDAFAILGLVEYFHATGKTAALDLALDTYRIVSVRLEKPGSYPTAPYPTPSGMRAHREYMQFSLAFSELGRATNDAKILADGRERGRIVLDRFLCTDRRVLLEYLDLDYTPCDTPEGRTMVPGHGVESLYFQLLNFGASNASGELTRASEGIRWCLERGWDPKFGGLFLGLDADGKEPVFWKNAEMKLWWPHTESLPACLMAYEQTQADWCLEWYAKIHRWAFAHFPVREHGEWTQRLDREGRKMNRVVALPVKDPFHLPRGLIFSIEALQRLEKHATTVEIPLALP